MKLSIDARELRSILKTLAPVDSRSLTLDLKSGTATASDSEMVIGARSAGLQSTESPDKIVVDKRQLTLVAAGLSGEIGLNLSNAGLILAAGRSRFQLAVMDNSSAVVTPVTEGEEISRLDFSAFRRAITAALSVTGNRRYNAIKIVSFDGAHPGFLRAVATDGARLIVADESQCPGANFMVSQRVARVLSELAVKELIVRETDSASYFDANHVLLVSKKRSVKFPDYNAVMTDTFRYRYSFSPQEARDALRRIAPMVNPDKPEIVVKFDRGIGFETADQSAQDWIDAQPVTTQDDFFDSSPEPAKLSHKHLLDFFTLVAEEPEAWVGINDRTNPVQMGAGSIRVAVAQYD